jgi:hypothetical protein
MSSLSDVHILSSQLIFWSNTILKQEDEPGRGREKGAQKRTAPIERNPDRKGPAAISNETFLGKIE